MKAAHKENFWGHETDDKAWEWSTRKVVFDKKSESEYSWVELDVAVQHSSDTRPYYAGLCGIHG